jgi:hypothetical protein
MADSLNERADKWEPPQGRFDVALGATLLHALGRGPEPSEDYYAFKCKFKLANFDVIYMIAKHLLAVANVGDRRQLSAKILRCEQARNFERHYSSVHSTRWNVQGQDYVHTTLLSSCEPDDVSPI